MEMKISTKLSKVIQEGFFKDIYHVSDYQVEILWGGSSSGPSYPLTLYAALCHPRPAGTLSSIKSVQ